MEGSFRMEIDAGEEYRSFMTGPGNNQVNKHRKTVNYSTSDTESYPDSDGEDKRKVFDNIRRDKKFLYNTFKDEPVDYWDQSDVYNSDSDVSSSENEKSFLLRRNKRSTSTSSSSSCTSTSSYSSTTSSSFTIRSIKPTLECINVAAVPKTDKILDVFNPLFYDLVNENYVAKFQGIKIGTTSPYFIACNKPEVDYDIMKIIINKRFGKCMFLHCGSCTALYCKRTSTFVVGPRSNKPNRMLMEMIANFAQVKLMVKNNRNIISPNATIGYSIAKAVIGQSYKPATDIIRTDQSDNLEALSLFLFGLKSSALEWDILYYKNTWAGVVEHLDGLRGHNTELLKEFFAQHTCSCFDTLDLIKLSELRFLRPKKSASVAFKAELSKLVGDNSLVKLLFGNTSVEQVFGINDTDVRMVLREELLYCLTNNIKCDIITMENVVPLMDYHRMITSERSLLAFAKKFYLKSYEDYDVNEYIGYNVGCTFRDTYCKKETSIASCEKLINQLKSTNDELRNKITINNKKRHAEVDAALRNNPLADLQAIDDHWDDINELLQDKLVLAVDNVREADVRNVAVKASVFVGLFNRVERQQLLMTNANRQHFVEPY
jgi:hypothetical protein